MKMYWCSDQWNGDGAAELVVAPNASKARAYAFGMDAVQDCEFIDIQVRRAPGADIHIVPEKTEPYAIDPSSASSLIWRDAGGHDFESRWCGSCGKAEMNSWNGKPEWKVCDRCGHCGECGCECGKGWDIASVYGINYTNKHDMKQRGLR